MRNLKSPPHWVRNTIMTMKLFLYAALLAISAFADTVNYTYDDAGRLTMVTYGSGTTIVYSYDKAGNLLSRTVTSPNSSGDAAKGQRSGSKQRRAKESKSAPRGPR